MSLELFPESVLPLTTNSSNVGFFEHQAGVGTYGFDLSVNSYNIKTGTNPFNIFMFDGQTQADIYSADSFGSWGNDQCSGSAG